MIRLLTKSLRGSHIRTWLAIAGVATCTLLVIVIASAFRSVRIAMSDYIGLTKVDLWVAPRGADNLIRGSFISFIPLAEVDSIRVIPGVVAADPIQEAFLSVQPIGLRDPQKRLTLLTIGYRQPDGLGGPPAYFAGRAPNSREEIAIDRAAAYRMGVHVGEKIDLYGYPVIITGLTTGTNILATQFLFADFEAMATRTNTVGQASFVLIKVAAGTDRQHVIQLIEERFPHLRAYTWEYFTKSNEREISAGFIPLLALVTIIGLGAAAVLVSLLVLSVVDERRGDIAVLMALGTASNVIVKGILAQATVLSLKGTLIGIGLSYGLNIVLVTIFPTIPLRIAILEVVEIAFLFIVTGLVAAVVPVIKLNNVDPLEAFRS